VPPLRDAGACPPLAESAEGAINPLTPNPKSIFCAWAKFENDASAAQAKVMRTAIRDIRFNRNLLDNSDLNSKFNTLDAGRESGDAGTK
jgi:hypothetical protein